MVSRYLYISVFVLIAPFGALGHDTHKHGHSPPGHGVKSADGVLASANPIQRTRNFRVSYFTDVTPVPINKLHSWKLRVKTPQGKPVTGATIRVDGDMPAHGLGLPTKPRVTREIDDGVYLIEGMKFNMPGQWIVEFDIAANGKRDAAAFSLVLK